MGFIMPIAWKRAFPSNTVNDCVAESFLILLSLFEIGCTQPDVELPRYVLNWKQI
jgi:hypothetical protein